MRDDRAHLQTLLIALDASTGGLRRDECGDYAIIGKAADGPSRTQ